MIVGRRADYIEKIRRACAAWQRQDTMLSVSTPLNQSFFITALYCVIEIEGYELEDYRSWEDYPDEVFVDFYNYISRRDAGLKRAILAYLEKHIPKAKATAKLQMTLFD